MLNLSFILIKFFSAYFKAYYYLTNSSIDVLLDFNYIVYLLSQSFISIVLDFNKVGKASFNLSMIVIG